MSHVRHDEPGWNPYRWVEISASPVSLAAPAYHHRFEGLSGRFECTLEALTPLLVGRGDGRFFGAPDHPAIPGTSLKGAIRALAELVGNAAVPSARMDAVDPAHRHDRASQGAGSSWKLDIVARAFGYMGAGREAACHAGLIRFGDAALASTPVPPPRWPGFQVAPGRPKPEHQTFYPTNSARKLYHHKTGAAELTPPGGEIRDTYLKTVFPAPVGTTFRFIADFHNLRLEELMLFTYCLVLEEDVTVTLGPSALGPGFLEPVTLRGPLRHKIGGCKGLGGGSARLRVERLTLRTDPAARYRAGGDRVEPLEGAPLLEKLAGLTAPFVSRSARTMLQLRAMLVYDPSDPRTRDLNYPSYDWFQTDRELPDAEKGRIKPTI